MKTCQHQKSLKFNLKKLLTKNKTKASKNTKVRKLEEEKVLVHIESLRNW